MYCPMEHINYNVSGCILIVKSIVGYAGIIVRMYMYSSNNFCPTIFD